jgi:drug/metabolite transporter (DMT)-like permease
VSRKPLDHGLLAALITPVLMGIAPVFGKLAIHTGIDPYTLAAIRTCLAALLLWAIYLAFFRQYIYIFPAGLLGTVVVGAVNGFGSLLYYNGLLLLDNASLAQLLNMLYVIFTVLLVRLYGQQISLLNLLRVALAMFAVYLLTAGSSYITSVHTFGVLLMIGGAFMYALHVVLSQRIMFEMPSPTMALYALTWMGITVLVARLIYGLVSTTPQTWTGLFYSDGWIYVLGLTAVTALSRVTLFSGVRNIGSLQTILLNVAELGVTLMVAYIWLDERMTPVQWVGVVLLLVTVLLSRWDRGDKAAPLLTPVPIFNRAGKLPPFLEPPDPNA